MRVSAFEARCSERSMLVYVDPKRFEGKPLFLQRAGPDDYYVLADGHVAGRITRTLRTKSDAVWVWSLTGPSLTEPSLTSHGDAENFEVARSRIRAAFLQWLNWANLAAARGERVAWNT